MRRTLIALSLALAAATPALAQDFPPPPPVGEPKPFKSRLKGEWKAP